jgi:hypothetical protein
MLASRDFPRATSRLARAHSRARRRSLDRDYAVSEPVERQGLGRLKLSEYVGIRSRDAVVLVSEPVSQQVRPLGFERLVFLASAFSREPRQS